MDFEILVGDESVRDPRMIERRDLMMPSHLSPACTSVGQGAAYPAVRLVRVAQGLEQRGAEVIVQSIGQNDYGQLTHHIINHL